MPTTPRLFACRPRGVALSPNSPSIVGMVNKPNVILRRGPADGEVMYCPTPGDPIPFEDEGGGSTTYLDTDQLEERDGIMLRVYEPAR